jgi:hypothetical protein
VYHLPLLRVEETEAIDPYGDSAMKYLFVLCVVAVLGVGGFSGCGDETKVKKTETIQTPDGKTTVTDEKKVEKSGEKPPAP